MTIFISDTFTDTDAVLLENHSPGTGGAWLKDSGDAGNRFEILGNRIYAEGAAGAEYRNATIAPDEDVDVTFNVDYISDENVFLEIGVRVTSDQQDGVFVGWNDFSNELTLVEKDGGVEDSLDTGVALTRSDQEIRLSVIGTAAKVYVNDVEVLSGTTTITAAGYVAINKFGNTETSVMLLDLVAETVGGGSVPENSVAPAVTGTTTVGQVLTSTAGTWSESPDDYDYLWERADNLAFTANKETIETLNGSAGTSDTYTLVAGDASHFVRCTVTANNATGASDPAESNIVGPISGTNAAEKLRVISSNLRW